VGWSSGVRWRERDTMVCGLLSCVHNGIYG
jgi:hypothetical protein